MDNPTQPSEALPSGAAKFAEKHFKYLDKLRASGVTNMFGAAPFVQKRFRTSYDRASEILRAWMRTFDGKSPAAERAARANAVGDRDHAPASAAGA